MLIAAVRPRAAITVVTVVVVTVVTVGVSFSESTSQKILLTIA
jgi:hypothetical protein